MSLEINGRHVTGTLEKRMTLLDDVKSWADLNQYKEGCVDRKIMEVVNSVKGQPNSNPIPLLKFMNNYVSWNGYFALAVCSLTAKLGLSRDLFRDPEITLDCAADRSNYVASFVFDAARDEFNEGTTPRRAPHRTLAQAMMLRLVEIYPQMSAEAFNGLFTESETLKTLNRDVMIGYTGGESQNNTSQSRSGRIYQAFYGMGFHTGSEIFADMEFSTIDHTIKLHLPEVYHQLHTGLVKICGKELNAYHWLRAHSGHGQAVEQMHFALAVRAIEKGLLYSKMEDHKLALMAAKDGYLAFANNHQRFFELSVQ